MRLGSVGGRLAGAFAVLAIVFLNACQSIDFSLPRLTSPQPPPITALPPPQGEVIGQGTVRVALLLPMTAAGNGAKVAAEFRNAAIMAMDDFGLQTIQLVIKDTAGAPERAFAAASEAVQEGSSAVLGPLFAPEVTHAAQVLRPAGRIAVAFSSDRNVAGAGVYLNSFLPQGLVDRTISFAVKQGLRSFVAVVPNGPAGDIAETQLRQTMAMRGGQLLQVVRYDYDDASLQMAAAAVAANANLAQAIFIPDGGGSPNAVAAALRSNSVDLSTKKLLGTGQWTTSHLADPTLAGAWFADANQGTLGEYKARYKAKHGVDPSVNSALGYDAVALAVGVVKRFGAAGFVPRVLENPSGYTGYSGVFRFNASGTNERGYAVYEVGPGGVARVISPAPRTFGGS